MSGRGVSMRRPKKEAQRHNGEQWRWVTIQKCCVLKYLDSWTCTFISIKSKNPVQLESWAAAMCWPALFAGKMMQCCLQSVVREWKGRDKLEVLCKEAFLDYLACDVPSSVLNNDIFFSGVPSKCQEKGNQSDLKQLLYRTAFCLHVALTHLFPAWSECCFQSKGLFFITHGTLVFIKARIVLSLSCLFSPRAVHLGLLKIEISLILSTQNLSREISPGFRELLVVTSWGCCPNMCSFTQIEGKTVSVFIWGRTHATNKHWRLTHAREYYLNGSAGVTCTSH